MIGEGREKKGVSKDRFPKSLLGKPAGFEASLICCCVIWLIVTCARPLGRVFDLYA